MKEQRWELTPVFDEAILHLKASVFKWMEIVCDIERILSEGVAWVIKDNLHNREPFEFNEWWIE